MPNTPIKIELDTLSDAWDILGELGLSAALIPGNPVDIKPQELLKKLLSEKKLQQFVAVITGQTIEGVGKFSLELASRLITDFFCAMASELMPLAGMVQAIKANSAE